MKHLLPNQRRDFCLHSVLLGNVMTLVHVGYWSICNANSIIIALQLAIGHSSVRVPGLVGQNLFLFVSAVSYKTVTS